MEIGSTSAIFQKNDINTIFLLLFTFGKLYIKVTITVVLFETIFQLKI